MLGRGGGSRENYFQGCSLLRGRSDGEHVVLRLMCSCECFRYFLFRYLKFVFNATVASVLDAL